MQDLKNRKEFEEENRAESAAFMHGRKEKKEEEGKTHQQRGRKKIG